MKFFRAFIWLMIISSKVTTLYPVFKNITDHFLSNRFLLLDLSNKIDFSSLAMQGTATIIPISDSPIEKIVFIDFNDDYCNVPQKMKIFHLNSSSTATDISEKSPFYEPKDIISFCVNKNALHPLVMFNYILENGCAEQHVSELFSWINNKFVKVSHDQYTKNLQKWFTSNSGANTQLIYLKNYCEAEGRLLRLDEENNFSCSKKIKNVHHVAFSNNLANPLILVIRQTFPNKAKSKLFQFDSDNQFINISTQYPDLKNLAHLSFAHICSIQDKLHIYGLKNDGDAQFFCLDPINHSIVEITDSCGLAGNDLTGIMSLNFSDNSFIQDVCIIYNNGQAKLFNFCEGIFNDITDSCGINSQFLSNVNSVSIVQDELGTTLAINHSEGRQIKFCVFHNPEQRSYSRSKRIKRAIP